jgi:hypothetical protein
MCSSIDHFTRDFSARLEHSRPSTPHYVPTSCRTCASTLSLANLPSRARQEINIGSAAPGSRDITSPALSSRSILAYTRKPQPATYIPLLPHYFTFHNLHPTFYSHNANAFPQPYVSSPKPRHRPKQGQEPHGASSTSTSASRLAHFPLSTSKHAPPPNS